MNDRKFRIANAGNTTNHALDVLKTKGYSVVISPGASEDDAYGYCATKDGRDFIARDPVEVLGLVALWEQFGDNWRDQAVPAHHDALLSAAFDLEPEDQ